jgi:glycosyltransferase involved in cell wall biosynthesis
MPHVKHILFAPEYPPYKGGIAQYSLGLAEKLINEGLLDKVISLQPHPEGKPKVVSPAPNPGLRIKVVFLRRLISLFFLGYQKVWFWKQLKGLTKNDNVIVTSLFFDHSAVIINYCMRQNIRYELVLHGLDMIELALTKPDFLVSAISKSKGFIFNSKYTQTYFEKQFPDQKQKREVIYPLFDTRVYDKYEILTLDELQQKFIGVELESNRIIISVCRLVKRKGIDKSVKAIVPFLEAHPDWVYLIAGSGEEESFIQSQIPIHLKDRIVLIGSVSDQIKCSLLYHAKVFIMLNQDFGGGDLEGFGISFVEASYFKCWVIGGENGGVPEAVDITSNAFLINMNEEVYHQKVMETLKYILLQSSDEMLEKGRQFVIEKFALEQHSK